MLLIQVNIEKEDDEITSDIIENLVKKIYRASGLEEHGEVSVSLMDDTGIARLNRDYRKIDGPTDVLSFPQSEGMEFPTPDEEDFVPLIGDVVISIDTARRQAEEAGHSIKKEMTALLIHGILHLHGHDHMEPEESRIMKSREEEILKTLEGD